MHQYKIPISFICILILNYLFFISSFKQKEITSYYSSVLIFSHVVNWEG